MKKAMYYFAMFSIVTLLYNCGSSDDAPQFIQTTVNGQAIDPSRTIVYSDDIITLIDNNYESIASTITDSNGYYEFTFDYDVGKSYSVNRTSQYVYYEALEVLPVIEAGQLNTIDFIGWRPIIFKVKTTVSNNIFPELFFNSRDDNDLLGLYSFPFYTESEQSASSTNFLHGKPNTQMSIIFSYKDDSAENNHHERREIVNTVVQDTIALTYIVDCSAF